MTTLLIVAGVFGMLCFVAWWNWEHNTITLTMVDPPVVWRRGDSVTLEWIEGAEWEPPSGGFACGHRLVLISPPTYSAADDLQVKFKVEGE